MPNIQIRIASFVNKISTQSLRVSYSFRGRRIQIRYLKLQGSQGSYHGNQIWAKINQNCTDFSSAQEIENFFAQIVRFSGSANSNMLSGISGEPRELPWQPNLGKNKPKLHWFQFCARNREIYHKIKSFSGSANSNLVYKISRASGRLPWQPNLGKK